MKKQMMIFYAIVLTAAMMTGCGKKEAPEAKEELLVDVGQGSVEYYEPETIVGEVPPIPLRLEGVSYEVASLNSETFHFADRTFSDFLDVSALSVNGEDKFDTENEDFKFHGFALNAGGKPAMYVELTKDGELVEKYNEADESKYEIKALYTTAEMLSEHPNFISFGIRIYTGLSKDEIENLNGKGYSSSFDENTFYYPDVAGWTLGLEYKEGVFAKPMTNVETPEVPEGEEAPEALMSEVTDGLNLYGLYLFRGEARVSETTE